ncbi:MAG: hypothetical protein KC621_25200, partial [Myxococcales bacterium]|nr:hypothetical protein [Myxococcales bacterium]
MSADPSLPVLALTLHLFDEPSLGEPDQQARWERCYGPLFEVLEALPNLRFGLVLGGDLLARWEDDHPERLETVRRWLAEQRVELVATPLWEPVLSAIPERDAIAQIVSHAVLVKRLFGVRPRGSWLPYRQWDPGLPRVYERAEVDWVLVDDLAILRHHPGRPDPWGVWWTERGGHAVRMFATDARAVEMAGDVPIRDLLLYARGRAVQGAVVQFWALRADRFGLADQRDGEADARWLAEFLTGLAGAEHLRTETPSVAGTMAPERGRTYLPSCAPPDRDHPWERHLLVHPEADRLHKRMLRVSRQLGRWSNEVQKGEARPDPDGRIQAERYLLRAQGAEVFVPGDDPARRWRAWRDLVRAERQILR